MSKTRVALVGNPNVGKSSIFNLLTGLNQKTGNYPGITVDFKSGICNHANNSYEIVDLPGTYTLYPNSMDEEIVLQTLLDENHANFPDKVLVVVDALHMKRGLLLFQQIRELGFPTLLVVNLIDEAERKGINIHTDFLKEKLESHIVFTNARTGEGIDVLKSHLEKLDVLPLENYFEIPNEYKIFIQNIREDLPEISDFKAWLLLSQTKEKAIPELYRTRILAEKEKFKITSKRLQIVETVRRYSYLETILDKIVSKNTHKKSVTHVLDQIATHKFWGYILFFSILFVIFQSIFYLAQIPMDLIDGVFGNFSFWAKQNIPEGPIQSLIADGIIPGIGGVLVFIPQIAILFTFILLLEEVGYMSRVVYLMDSWLKPFGLSGKSVVPLMSGVACAIPAVMSARNIENDKERLITILVTPFMTCSARLPVYAILISLVIPKGDWWLMNYQGLALMALYVLGFLMALFAAFLLKFNIKSSYKSYLILDMPTYKLPIFKNIVFGVYLKCMDFVLGAGKIILAVSILLWALGTFGPNTKVNWDDASKWTGTELEESYLGIIGKSIEPVIEPLGYDWKIGIGILSSFAAREVFVPTMATIYSIDSDDDDASGLMSRMKKEYNTTTQQKTYSTATSISLLLFYAFAMQCISTIAVVKRETNSWRWAIAQLVFMTGIAYASAFAVYQLLS